MLRRLAGSHLVGSASVLGIAIGIALLTRLERLVLHFFEQRIFGPTRLDKLAKQLRAHDRDQRRNGKLAGTRIGQQVAELDRKITAQATTAWTRVVSLSPRFRSN